MNNKHIITKIDDKTYELITADGQSFICSVWVENKKDKTYEHVKLPKVASEITGRTYIRTSVVGDRYEFETKTEHREGIGSGGWKSKMTAEELAEYEECEKRMNEIKEAAMAREVSEEDRILAQIAKLQAKLTTLKN